MAVYFIRFGDTEYVKVGFATEVKRRQKELQTSAPLKLKLLWAVEGDRLTEQMLHKTLNARRREGEWFSIPETDIQAFLQDEFHLSVRGVQDAGGALCFKDWVRDLERAEHSDYVGCFMRRLQFLQWEMPADLRGHIHNDFFKEVSVVTTLSCVADMSERYFRYLSAFEPAVDSAVLHTFCEEFYIAQESLATLIRDQRYHAGKVLELAHDNYWRDYDSQNCVHTCHVKD